MTSSTVSFVREEFDDMARTVLLEVVRSRIVELSKITDDYENLLKKIETIMYYDAESHFHEIFNTNLKIIAEKLERLTFDFTNIYSQDLRRVSLNKIRKLND